MNTIESKVVDIQYPKVLSRVVEYSVEKAISIADYTYDNGVRCVVDIDEEGTIEVKFLDFETKEPKSVNEEFGRFAVKKQIKRLFKVAGLECPPLELK
jgi:hypothetical protein